MHSLRNSAYDTDKFFIQMIKHHDTYSVVTQSQRLCHITSNIYGLKRITHHDSLSCFNTFQ